MAGTVVIDYEDIYTIKKLTFDWLSSSGGAADATTKKIVGQILRVGFTPDGGGTQPSLNYDVVINDEQSIDVLQGLGANLSNVTATNVVPVVTNGTAGNMAPAVITDILTLAVTNAGNAKGGEIAIWYR